MSNRVVGFKFATTPFELKSKPLLLTSNEIPETKRRDDIWRGTVHQRILDVTYSA